MSCTDQWFKVTFSQSTCCGAHHEMLQRLLLLAQLASAAVRSLSVRKIHIIVMKF